MTTYDHYYSVQTIADVVATSKLSFTPPLDPFPLCSYGLRSHKKVPLRGFFQMKEVSANVVNILMLVFFFFSFFFFNKKLLFVLFVFLNIRRNASAAETRNRYQQ